MATSRLNSGQWKFAGGVCDSCDKCGIEDCTYYDLSREGTRKFWWGLCYEHTLDGLLMRERDKEWVKRQRAVRSQTQE